MKTSGFFTPSLNGLLLKDVKDFKEEQNWKSPILKFYFDNYRIDSEVYKTSILNEVIEKTLAVLLLILFSPIMICTAIAIKISSKGDIFYKQVRVGKDGENFEIYKFRTMITGAEKKTGHTLSWEGDPRITKLGRFLRKSHFDELPQLFNVIMGDMGFIGPRPERPEFTSIYNEEIKNYEDRHTIKPGITGLAQIALVYDASAANKLKYDLMYIGFKESWILNILISLYTAKKMLFMKSKVNLI